MGRNLLETSTHFVWATWDRLPLITPEMERALCCCMTDICRNHKCEVLAVGTMPDHVHLLVMVGSAVSLGDLMQQVKGGTSRCRAAEPGQSHRLHRQPEAASRRRKALARTGAGS